MIYNESVLIVCYLNLISYGHRENCHICSLIHVLVTGVPLVSQKKGLGQRCLNDKNDFSGNTGQFYVQLVICRLQVCEWPMLQIIWRIEMGTSVNCLLFGPVNNFLNLDSCCRKIRFLNILNTLYVSPLNNTFYYKYYKTNNLKMHSLFCFWSFGI